MRMTPAKAIARIKAGDCCADARAEALGLYVNRGRYRSTTDHRLDHTWFIDTLAVPIDRRGDGYRTKTSALADITRKVVAGLITDLCRSQYS